MKHPRATDGNPAKVVVKLPPIAMPTTPQHAEGEGGVEDSVGAHGDEGVPTDDTGHSARSTGKRCKEELPGQSPRRHVQGEQRPPKLTHSASHRVPQLSLNASISLRMLDRAKRHGLTRRGLTRTASTVCASSGEKRTPQAGAGSAPQGSGADDGGRHTAREPSLAVAASEASMLRYASCSKMTTVPTWGGRSADNARDIGTDEHRDDSLETAERWLAETLDQSPSVAALKRADEILCTLDFSRADTVEPPHGTRRDPQWSSRRSLVLSGIGRRELRAQRVPLAVLERVYPALYVYSSGVFEFLRKATAHCDDANVVLASLWTAYALLLEQCFPSEYEMAVQGVTNKLANTVNSLSERFESHFESFTKEEKRNKTTIISCEQEISRLKLRNERLGDDLSKITEEHKSLNVMRHVLATQSLDLSEELQKVRAKSEELQQDNVRLAANFECCQELLQVERDRSGKLELSVKTEKSRASSLIASLKDKEDEVSKLRLDTKAKSESIQCLEVSSARVSEQLESTTRSLEEMSSRLSSTREALAALEVSYNALSEEKQQLLGRNSELCADLASSQAAAAEQSSKRREAELSLAEITPHFREIRARLEETVSVKECLQQENSRLSTELRSEREKLVGARAAEESLQEKIAALELKHSSLQTSMQQAKELMEEAQKECGITSRKLAESERKLKHEQRNAIALQKKKIEDAAKFRSKIESVSQALASTRNEIAATKEAKRILEGDNTKLSDQLKAMSLEREALTRQVSAAKRDLAVSQVAHSDMQKQAEADRASLELSQEANIQLTEKVKVVKAARFQDQKRADHSRVQMKSATAERDIALKALAKSEAQLVNERAERIELEAQHEATILSLRSELSSLREKTKLAAVLEDVTMPREKCELLLLLNDASDVETEIEKAKGLKATNKEIMEKVASEITKQKSALTARETSLAQVQAEVDAAFKSLKELLASKTYANYESKVVEMKKTINHLEARCSSLQSSLDAVDEQKSRRCTQATQIGVYGLQQEWRMSQLSKLRDAASEPEISYGVDGEDLSREVRSLMKIVHEDIGSQTDGEGVPAFSLVGYFDKHPGAVLPPAHPVAPGGSADRGVHKDQMPRTMHAGQRIGGGGHASSRTIFSPRRKRKLRLGHNKALLSKTNDYDVSLRRHSSLSYLLLPSVLERGCLHPPSQSKSYQDTRTSSPREQG